jgi:fumarylacetoacetase
MTLFGLDNLPYGVFTLETGPRRIGVRLGDAVLDLTHLGGVFQQPTLNPLMSLGRPRWAELRAAIVETAPDLPRIPLDTVRLHLPFDVADYTDFYSSEHHATNVSRILRPANPGLPPAWKRLPIGYHGRSATVVVSGTPVERPHGQLGVDVFGPSERLDIEAEVGFVVGTPGRRIATGDFAEHVFLSKSFATSVSPWVVPLAAFASLAAPAQDPRPQPYLLPPGPALDVELRVEWNDTEVSNPPYAQMYWTAAQQLAHLTVNGAAVRTGDLYASGTVSGPAREQAGSFLELTSNGEQPVKLADGAERAFLLDGDTVTISATAAGASGARIGLGEVTGTVCP